MKNARVFTILILTVFLFSAWTPAPVSARPADSPVTMGPGSPGLTVDPVAPKVVPLWIKNRTGGVLFVTIEGPKTYNFTIPDEKSKFLIVPGWYRVKAISTACSATFEDRKNFNQGGNLVYYCDSGGNMDPAAPKGVPLWVKNRTGGVLFVTLEGPESYHFTVPGDKSKFLIVPGWYRVTAISTGCSDSYEQRENFKQGGNLVYYCDSR
jgi:hypothetical protein